MNAVELNGTFHHTASAGPISVFRFSSNDCAAHVPDIDAVLPPEQTPSTAIYILLRAQVEQEVLVLLYTLIKGRARLVKNCSNSFSK